MTKEQARKRVERLKSLINKHRYLYHVKDTQEISDEAFDALKHELFLLEQKFPDLLTPDSPTQRVGGEALSAFSKVPHRFPMLSIEDVFAEEELKDWERYLSRLVGTVPTNLEYFAELKIDGFAVSLLYKNGVLHRAATRGDGQVGEDVTQNVRTIESVPLSLELHERLKDSVIQRAFEDAARGGEIEVRGEIYMAKKDFERFNEERKKAGEEPYANPRNLAAGSIRQLDPKLAAGRPLKFMAYDLVTDAGQEKHSQEHEILSALGFKTDETARVCASIADVVLYWKQIGTKRDSLPFLIDGIVAVVNDNRIFNALGVAGKSPRGIRAFKFSGKQAVTKIQDVKFQVGRTGAITPVALLSPVQLAGVTVSRASLHNEDEIRRLGVKIGDTVIVERAGDVIPAVIRVLPELRDGGETSVRIPKKCPSCGSVLVKPAGEVVLRCESKDCKAKKLEFLYHFVSRKAFDIAGLGPKIIDKLAEENLVSEPADFFALKEGDIAPLERFAEKSASNLVASIQKAKKVTLSRFLYALGIRHLGEETAIDLAAHFSAPTGGESLKRIQSAQREELEAIEGIGIVVARSIYEWFSHDENRYMIDRILDSGVHISNELKLNKSFKPGISGKIFVFTGTLSGLSRDKAKGMVRLAGGEVSDAVSAKTGFLVAGADPGSKLAEARRLGITVISEGEFLKLFAG